jgi:hypothetical protein
MILPMSHQLFICKLEKGALTGLSIANPKFSDIPLSVEYLQEVRSPESVLK